MTFSKIGAVPLSELRAILDRHKTAQCQKCGHLFDPQPHIERRRRMREKWDRLDTPFPALLQGDAPPKNCSLCALRCLARSLAEPRYNVGPYAARFGLGGRKTRRRRAR